MAALMTIKDIAEGDISGRFTSVQKLPDYQLGWFVPDELGYRVPILVKTRTQKQSVRTPSDWQMWDKIDLGDSDDLNYLASAPWRNPENGKAFDAKVALNIK